MTAIAAGSRETGNAAGEADPFPETVQVTAGTVLAWRGAGYAVGELRKGTWLYLVTRGKGRSAVYRLVGPRFDERVVVYDGFRVA